MKVRIKKTGTLLEDVKSIDTTSHKFIIQYLDNGVPREYLIENLSDIEEVKDRKDYWFIDCDGEINQVTDTRTIFDTTCEEIGNYFSSREEAEKAVKKLKAWKRLKDKGFKIRLQNLKGYSCLEANWDVLEGDYSDVRLLFGGEE